MDVVSAITEQLTLLANYTAAVTTKVFLHPAGAFSFASIGSALLLATAVLYVRRARRKRPLRFKVLARALFPRRLYETASAQTDLGFLVFNVFLFSLMFGWAILSAQFVARNLQFGLEAAFGASAPTALPEALVMALFTLVLFVAYEFSYWLDHMLAHKIPFLWEFHKVHHAAESLSPATNARVHPVDTVVFYNISALCMGLAGGAFQYAFGMPVKPYTLWNVNAITLLFAFTINHLHHSHVWIAFTGLWGRIILSPAHHQIHHSNNVIHFDKNFGGSLAVFDWIFGTLCMPGKTRETLVFGVDGYGDDPHSLKGSMLSPFAHAAARIWPKRETDSAPAISRNVEV